ncbi:HlyD family type I secretion periplasmic adaptor subunit [Sphingomonas sp. GCM10030256]|uniref:HlyD family type I secretion periplasmic adaptor subunit n=1 Tax=Sphingomonas sp. GCM10030256 TaxID=3273427 RepID=UPI0036156315
MNAIVIDRSALDPRLRSEFDETPRREFRHGGIVAGLFFVGLIGGAALIPLDAGAYAEAVVAVSGHRQAVQHRDGGIVTDIMVAEGQQVRKGDVLLKVSASELVATERGITGEVISLLANRARLLAEQAGAPVVHEPKEFGAFSGNDRELALQAMDGQRRLFAARRASLETERGVLSQRMRQHSEQIGGYSHQMAANRVQQRLIADEIGGLRELLPKGYVSMNRLRAVERTASELNGAHGAYRAEIARSAEARGEARLQIVVLDKERFTEVATQLRDVQVRLDELQPKLVALREQLARSIVRAPASGKVVGLKVFTEGGVVAAGDKLMEIVPQDRQLIVEGKASPTDADDLRPGMTTQVRFTGLHERNLPILKGQLTKVSADSFEDERTGARFFRIEVSVPPEQLELIRQVRPDGGLRAGLPAEVLVPLRKRTALGYLIEPVTQSLWKAGREH